MIKSIKLLRHNKNYPFLGNMIHYQMKQSSPKYFFNQVYAENKQEQSTLKLQKIRMMMKDFQLGQALNISQTEEGLFNEKLALKQKILSKLSQYIDFLNQNKVELNKYLVEVNANCFQIVEDIKTLSSELDQFIERSSKMQIAQRRIKKQILQFLYQSILEHHNEDRLFHKLAYILQVQIKLRSAFKHFQYTMKKQKNILNSDPSQYIQAWNQVNYITFPDNQKIEQEYKNVEKLLHAISGAVYKTPNKNQGFLESINFSYKLLRNYLKFELGLLSSLRMLKTPTIESTSKYLDLYQFGIYKHLSTYSFPKIETNTMMYVPLGQYEENIDIFKESANSIPVRILHHQQLPLVSRDNEHQGDDVTTQIEDIIIHMHGGGFVGLSSHTTQNYTRIWANQLKIPLFSIDYRMPPYCSFPTAPEDCLRVYQFLVNHIHKYIKIRPKNIYLCGDSAGGNLSCALTALLMKNNLMIPKGMYIVYPLLDSRQKYYPSRKYILHDPLLWPPMAELFSNSYLRKKQDQFSPLASPVLLTEGFVVGEEKEDNRFPLKWPITYMTVGSMDPLRDESIYFLQRLVQSNIRCKLTVFQHLRHAIFSTSKIIKQSDQALQYSIADFKQMIQRSKHDVY